MLYFVLVDEYLFDHRSFTIEQPANHLRQKHEPRLETQHVLHGLGIRELDTSVQVSE